MAARVAARHAERAARRSSADTSAHKSTEPEGPRIEKKCSLEGGEIARHSEQRDRRDARGEAVRGRGRPRRPQRRTDATHPRRRQVRAAARPRRHRRVAVASRFCRRHHRSESREDRAAQARPPRRPVPAAARARILTYRSPPRERHASVSYTRRARSARRATAPPGARARSTTDATPPDCATPPAPRNGRRRA